MAFRRKGTEEPAGLCWCGAEAIKTSGLDTDDKPWFFVTCTKDIFHDVLGGRPLPLHRTEAGYPNCSTCGGGGCLDCTDPA